MNQTKRKSLIDLNEFWITFKNLKYFYEHLADLFMACLEDACKNIAKLLDGILLTTKLYCLFNLIII